MDHISDFGNFQHLMRRLCETMGKPVTDELIEAWWKSLRMVRFEELERRMDLFMARATDVTRFPRPAQFRPESAPQPSDPKEEARDRRIAADSARHWREFCQRYPRTGPIRMKLSHCARIIAAEPPESTAHAEALYESEQLEQQLGGRFGADA